MRQTIFAGMIGNALEWYDFALYGHMSLIIAALFFPESNPIVSLIAAYGLFAAGFIMRPIGGLVFGYIGDTFGRRTALMISIVMMSFSTLAVGLLPTYNTIGIWAPVALLALRLIQGLSLGGEFSGSIIYVIEHAPNDKKAIFGGTAFISMCCGILLGSIVIFTLSSMLPTHNLRHWGWRIPFILSLVLSILALYTRRTLHESAEYLAHKQAGNLSEQPFVEILSHHKNSLFLAIAIYLTATVPFTTLMLFLQSYLVAVLHHSPQDASKLNIIIIMLMMCLLPIFGYITDRVGRKPMLVAGAISIIIFTYPAFLLLAKPVFAYQLLGCIILTTAVTLYQAPIPVMLTGMFPTRVRFTGVAMTCNICAALFGGTTPSVALWLIKTTNINSILALYLIMFAIVSLIALYYYRAESIH